MVSNSPARPGISLKKNPEKKPKGENAAQRSPSPPSSKGREALAAAAAQRYEFEFDGKAVPKGLRTDREKKKIFAKKPGPEPENESFQAGGAGEPPGEHMKHSERVRGSRSNKPRSRAEQAELGEEYEDPQKQKPGNNTGAEELEQKKESAEDEDGTNTPQDAKQTHEQVPQAQGPSPGVEELENHIKPPLETTEETSKLQEVEVTGEKVPPDMNPGPNIDHTTNGCQPVDEQLLENKVRVNLPEGNEELTKASHPAECLPQEEAKEEEKKVGNPEPDTSLSLGLSGSHHHRVKRVRSVQSFSQAETFSHGVTTSLSLSCSHAFTHNPSCSLTQTSLENNNNTQEFSSASQPVFHETSRGDGVRLGDQSGSNVRGRGESHHHRVHKKLMRASGSGGFTRSAPVPSTQFAPGMLTVREVVSDPVPLVARKIHALSAETIGELKSSVRDLLERGDKKEESLQLQRILQSRTDLVDDVLQTAHRAQLEMLVALKTGIPAFLSSEQQHQARALVDIFLNLRCRKAQCLSQLPADNCECKLCTQGNGFCNVCMCVVCSTFDFEQNTCAWVGCDFCIHWCHTDCGLRKCFIKPGPAINGGPGTSEMQFHCLVCGKTSELFGFVKDVFTSCAEGWSRAQLCKELDCARRMFQGSQDLRGKQLCWKAGHLFGRLEGSDSLDTAEACKSMLKFFEDGAINPLEEEAQREGGGGVAAGARDAAASIVERAAMALQSYDRVLEEKRSDAAEMQYERAKKRAEIEELESIVRIKQAEAKMFQSRADEAAQEAEGLRRIVLAKRLKVEEEYAAKKSKLQLLEAEEKRKRKFETLKMLESGSCNFEVMRKVMGDLQGLLNSMEAAKRFKTEEESGVEKYLQRYLQQSR